MNKNDLIEAVASKGVFPKTKVNELLGTVLEAITKALGKGESVTLVGFGTFSVKKRAARTGRNPQTGAAIKIPAHKVVRFSVGKKLKKLVDKK